MTEKQPLFSAPFSFSGRIRRLEFIITYLLGYVYAFIVGPICERLPENIGTMLILILAIPFFWFRFAQGAKRCYDLDNSGFYQLIPFYFILLLFADGDPYENDYGPDPKGRDIYE